VVSSSSGYEFGPFRLDPSQKLLLREGSAVPLMPKVFDLLCLLVEQNGQLIDRQSLLQRLWPDTFVEEGNLSKAMFLLRQALGQKGNAGPYIETVPKRGYRFIAEVSRRAAAHAGRQPENQPPAIAVLPFLDLSAEHDQEYFCEGISEEIINALSQVPGIRIASRSSSFQLGGKGTDVREVGRALNVTFALEGSVRKFGNRLRIAVQFVHASNGIQIWSQRFDREGADIFAIQEEIASAIVTMAAPELLKTRPLIRRHTENPEAYQLYLRGRYFWNRRPGEVVQKALQCFQRALELDPNFAAAHAGIADAYATLGSWEAGVLPPTEALVAARNAARKALAIDPSLAEAHTSLAYAAQHFEWNVTEAEALFRKAIDLNPSYTGARHWHSHCLMAACRTEESLAESRKALELYPLDVVLNFHLAWHYQMSRQADETIEQANRVVSMDPGLHWGHYFLASGHELKGQYDKAVEALRNACTVSSGHPVMRAWYGHAVARAGERREALEVAREVLALGETRGHFAYEAALIHAALGDLDLAFRLLDRARMQRSGYMSYLLVDPRLDMVRSDPRFEQLVASVGLSASRRARLAGSHK
jgi:TolB-like protein/Tfp pilus assembly protein PilF